MSSAEAAHRPYVVAETAGSGQGKEFWMIGGRLHPVRQASAPVGAHGEKVAAPDASASMTDVGLRVRHMDELGTDVQVLYPTLFINPITSDPAVELALCHAYNRWLADIWSHGRGRLRWAAVLPLLSMDEALRELRQVRGQGACAVFVRGIECGNRLLSDPYFFPLYQAAADLDLPVCVHTGNSSPEIFNLFADESGFARFKLVGVGAFHAIVYAGIMARFPGLRFGFIELSAQWLPYVIHDLKRRFERRERPFPANLLKENRIYVTCQTNDDLPHIISYVGDENLVIGTDYGHADTSSELYALQTFKQQAPISESSRQKILDDNARALYGL